MVLRNVCCGGEPRGRAIITIINVVVVWCKHCCWDKYLQPYCGTIFASFVLSHHPPTKDCVTGNNNSCSTTIPPYHAWVVLLLLLVCRCLTVGSPFRHGLCTARLAPTAPGGRFVLYDTSPSRYHAHDPAPHTPRGVVPISRHTRPGAQSRHLSQLCATSRGSGSPVSRLAGACVRACVRGHKCGGG